jgi:hypothetical protein
MSAPQLTDASTSSEWIRTVAEAATSDKRRNPSQASIAREVADARRKRFVRLVTYTMVGLVGFTVLGIASFAWRQHAMQSVLAAPVPAALEAPVAPSPAPLLAPEAAPTRDVAPPPAAVSPTVKAAVAKKAIKRSPLSSTKPTTKSAKR